MSKIVRNEFMGSWLLFSLLCLTVIGIPLAILYLLTGTIRIENEMEDPEKFIADLRAGNVGRSGN
jgi:hypothetical protein